MAHDVQRKDLAAASQLRSTSDTVGQQTVQVHPQTVPHPFQSNILSLNSPVVAAKADKVVVQDGHFDGLAVVSSGHRFPVAKKTQTTPMMEPRST